MSAIVVHGIPGSPFLRSVLATLEEKGQTYRLNVMGPGDSKKPEYLKRHPFGRVPAFEHGDFALYETQAILRYLDAAFPEPALQPKDARQAARDLADRQRAVAQALEHGAPGRVGQGWKHGLCVSHHLP